MTQQRQFAAWVEPFAGRFRESRGEAVRLARELGDGDLAVSTGDAGWSVRDELAHISASESDFLEVLGAIVRGEAPDTSAFADIDGRNARNLAALEGRPMADIAHDLEDHGRTLQELLGRLSDGDEGQQPAGIPFSMSGLLGGYAQHEPYHLDQIHAALRRAREATR